MEESYTLEDYRKLADNIYFFRIRINQDNVSITLREILNCLNELSWISKFDKEYLRDSFNKRATDTINYIATNIINGTEAEVTTNSGEYVVSVLSKKAIVDKLDYLDVPLAELIKEKVVGNPGFDFYSENKNSILLFGEAKYVAKTNAYNNALKQIEEFSISGKDINDIASIDRFFSEEALKNANDGNKGYIAAFSSTEIETEDLIKNIQNNEHYKNLSSHKELICVAVTI
jgi:hypothetical protein